MTTGQTATIRRKLLSWFDRNRRDLPWRRTRDPYRVWLSEIMLQQTQVATVWPFYERFLGRFPSVGDLAAGKLDEVMRLWAGLGYYARARNLHRAAKMMVDEMDGKFPKTAEELRDLPGIGTYTAGAIASICNDESVPAVDCNVERVLSRLFGIEEDIGATATKKHLLELACSLIPKARCGDFNQAVIELGATICLPGGAARCRDCPIRHGCAACMSGKVDKLPVKLAKTKIREETHVVAAIEHRGRFLFRQRPASGLWGGLWEMPSAVLNGEPAAELVRKLLNAHVRGRCEVQPRPFCEFRRQLTHRTIQFQAYRCVSNIEKPKSQKVKTSLADSQAPASTSRWLMLEEAQMLGFSTAMRQVLKSLEADITRE